VFSRLRICRDIDIHRGTNSRKAEIEPASVAPLAKQQHVILKGDYVEVVKHGTTFKKWHANQQDSLWASTGQHLISQPQ
jgi:hypothetical protein